MKQIRELANLVCYPAIFIILFLTLLPLAVLLESITPVYISIPPFPIEVSYNIFEVPLLGKLVQSNIHQKIAVIAGNSIATAVNSTLVIFKKEIAQLVLILLILFLMAFFSIQKYRAYKLTAYSITPALNHLLAVKSHKLNTDLQNITKKNWMFGPIAKIQSLREQNKSEFNI